MSRDKTIVFYRVFLLACTFVSLSLSLSHSFFLSFSLSFIRMDVSKISKKGQGSEFRRWNRVLENHRIPPHLSNPSLPQLPNNKIFSLA